MSTFDLVIYLLKFYIPAMWSLVFRAVAFGYASKRRLALGLGFYTIYSFLVPGTIMWLIGYGQYKFISGLVMVVGSMAVLIFTTDTLGKTIFLHLTQGCMVTIVSVLLNLPRTLFGMSYAALVVMLLVACPILFCLGLRYWAAPLRFIVDHSQGSIALLLFLLLITTGIANTLPTYPPRTFAEHPVFCTVMVVAVEMAYLLHLYALYRDMRRIVVLSEQRSRSELLVQEIESYQGYLDAARRSRHDLRHHDALLAERLEEGDVEGALSYLRAHDEQLTEGALVRFCSEPTVNATLRIYARRARELDVDFSASARLPEVLPLDGPELGSMLANLLENALHATAGIEGGLVSFDAGVQDDSLLIEVANTVEGTVHMRDGLPCARWSQGGTGTRSVAATVADHGGILAFSQEGAIFRARIVMPLTQAQEA